MCVCACVCVCYTASLTCKQFRENVGHIFVDSTPLVRLPEVTDRAARMLMCHPTCPFPYSSFSLFNSPSSSPPPHLSFLQTRLVDYSSIDVFLISNCFSMLALPFLTEVMLPLTKVLPAIWPILYYRSLAFVEKSMLLSQQFTLAGKLVSVCVCGVCMCVVCMYVV